MVDLALLWTGLMRLHGSMDKKQRSAAFNAFHTAESGVLLCTGVACPWPQPTTVPTHTPRTSYKLRKNGRFLLFYILNQKHPNSSSLPQIT